MMTIPLPDAPADPADLFGYSTAIDPFVNPAIAIWQIVATSINVRFSSVFAADELDRLSVLLKAVRWTIDDVRIAYLDTNPAVLAGLISAVVVPMCLFGFSTGTGNCSQVDRLWGFLPMLYAGHYVLWAWMQNLPLARPGLTAAVVAIWGIRISLNYYRKGGFSAGSEDYRWEVIRNRVPRLAFMLLNATFVSTIQSVLLYAITLPVYCQVVLGRMDSQPNVVDFGFAAALVGLVMLETVADQQQWKFQTAKQAYLETARKPSDMSESALELGFCTHGLWKYSRHPNFFAEQAFWVAIGLWPIALRYATMPVVADALSTLAQYPLFFRLHVGVAEGLAAAPSSPVLTLPSVVTVPGGPSWENVVDALKSLVPPLYLLVGPATYVAIIMASTSLTESITGSKYPGYAAYQAKVGRFMPAFLCPLVRSSCSSSTWNETDTIKQVERREKPTKDRKDNREAARDGLAGRFLELSKPRSGWPTGSNDDRSIKTGQSVSSTTAVAGTPLWRSSVF